MKKTIFEKTKIPSALVDDKDGFIIEFNKGFEAITQLSSEIIKRKTIHELLEFQGQNFLPFYGQEVLGAPDQIWSLKGAEGISVSVRIEEIPFEENGFKGKIIFFFDCTSNEEIFADYLHMSRLASLGKFVSGVIHEISNPLSIISGCAQLLSAKQLPDEIKEDITRISSESRRTSELIRTVLSFSRKKEEVLETFSIKDVIHEVVSLKRYSLKHNNIKLQEIIPFKAGHLLIKGYRTQLMQVMLNLINNSEHAIGRSGGKGSISLMVERLQDCIEITISDTGPGIESSKQDKIFEAFYTTKDVNHGTGLGLYISRNIIRKHGGDLSLLESKAGNTKFKISIPLSDKISSVNSKPDLKVFRNELV